MIASAGATYAAAEDAPPVAVAAPSHVAQSVVRTPIRVDLAHPLRIGAAYYPKESLRKHEQGTCLVKVTVQADGHTRDVSIVHSSGYPRLDEACLKAWYPAQLIAATENGVPVETTAKIPTAWKLTR